MLTAACKSAGLIIRLITQAFPLVDHELALWHSKACKDLETTLQQQAVDSIEKKRFHCLGGSVFSLYPGVPIHRMTRFIVAFQTISDYLDNLCDRLQVTDEAAFRQLHGAMLLAVKPDYPQENYYQYYPYQQDSGYLPSLVETCQKIVATLPSYQLVQTDIISLTALYCDLQTYKHLRISVREDKLSAWNMSHSLPYSDLIAYEFSAAAGSTLAIFLFCALAAQPNLSQIEIEQARSVYFPWICALHILLDYYIDRKEDRLNKDLNFFTYYQTEKLGEERLLYFMRQARYHARDLPKPAFTQTLIDGLLALYLSDPKIKTQKEKALRQKLLYASSFTAKAAYFLCSALRRCHKI